MNHNLRTLTLSAAALAALMVIAPKAFADDHGRGRRAESPRQEFRENERHEWRGPEVRGHFRYAAPRPVVRYGYGYVSPYRVFSGFRFCSACPGPSYVYIANYGWVLPPFFGAVWVPGHLDFRGYRVEGFWR
jgi:hypothetical protein